MNNESGVNSGNGYDYSKAMLQYNKQRNAADIAGSIASAGSPLLYKTISNGLSSKGGEIVSNAGTIAGAGLTAASALGMVNPLVGVGVALGSALLGGIGNRLWGYKLNQGNINNVKSNIDLMKGYRSNVGDYDSLAQNALNAPSPLAFNKRYLGKAGIRSGKINRLYDSLNTQQDLAFQNVQQQNKNNAYNINMNQGLTARNLSFALGGQLGQSISGALDYAMATDMLNQRAFENQNKMAPVVFAFGGTKPKARSHGADFTNGVTFVNNGGTHEDNAYGGVTMGTDPQGVPNQVEEGEVVYNDFVFSNRIQVPNEVKEALGLRGKNITFAKAAKQIQKESEERPNDPISKRGLEAAMGALAQAQEQYKQQQMVMQQQAQQMVAQQIAQEQQLQQEQQMQQASPMDALMGAYGGLLAQPVMQDTNQFAFGNFMIPVSKKRVQPAFGDMNTYGSNLLLKGLGVNRRAVPMFTGLDDDFDDWWNQNVNKGNPYAQVDFNKVYNYFFPDQTAPKSSTEGMNNLRAIYGTENYKDKFDNFNYDLLTSDARAAQKRMATQAPSSVSPTLPTIPVSGPLGQDVLNWLNGLPQDEYDAFVNGINWGNRKQKTFGTRQDLFNYANQGKPGAVYNAITGEIQRRANAAASIPQVAPVVVQQPLDLEQVSDDNLEVPIAQNPYSFPPGVSPKLLPYMLLPYVKNMTDEQRQAYFGKSPADEISIGDAFNNLGIDTNSIKLPGMNPYVTSKIMQFPMDWDAYVSSNPEDVALAEKMPFNPRTKTVKEAYKNGELGDQTYKDSWLMGLRWAPVIGGGINVLSDLFGLTNKADYSNADSVINTATSNLRQVKAPQLGDYMGPNKFDRLFHLIPLLKEAGRGVSAIQNSAAGNVGAANAAIVSLIKNAQEQSANLERQGEEFNRADDFKVAEYNKDTNNTNATLSLEAQAANNQSASARVQAAAQAAAIRDAVDQRLGAARTLNLTNFFNSLGNVGLDAINQRDRDLLLYAGVYGKLPNWWRPYGMFQDNWRTLRNSSRQNSNKQKGEG